jgi:FKBP-type peptidyl-prolyl cis-trans isomerase FkpA
MRMRRWSCGMLMMLAACGSAAAGVQAPAAAPEAMQFAPALEVNLAAMERLSAGVYVRDIRAGEGPSVVRGDRVTVRYVGWLPDGTVFDAIVPPSTPREFRLGDREVIRGWESGLLGMKAGGQRQLVVPPDQGYGARREGNIPPNSTLVFLVELVSVR